MRPGMIAPSFAHAQMSSIQLSSRGGCHCNLFLLKEENQVDSSGFDLLLPIVCLILLCEDEGLLQRMLPQLALSR